jgi:hypothetical protein
MNETTKQKLLFPLGQIVATPGALEALRDQQCPHETTLNLIVRHATGDWGNVDVEDREANDRSVEDGTRILSSYDLDGGGRVWIITEADRSATTILLPEEY